MRVIQVIPAAALALLAIPQGASANLVTIARIAVQGGPGQQQKPAAKDYDETIKGYNKMPGVFNIYRKKDGSSDSILMEIPPNFIGKYAMVQATASTGTADTPTVVFHGQPLGDIVFHITTVDDGSRVLFMQPNLAFRAPSDEQSANTLKRAIPESVLSSFDVKAKQKESGNILIDVTGFFKSDFVDFGDQFKAPPPMTGMSYGVDPMNTFIDSVKVFPENAVIRTMYRLAWRGSAEANDKTSIPFGVNYNLSVLPEDGYRPRIADTRIGYFTTNWSDMSDPANYRRTVNYIYRWKIEKANPEAAVSDPKEPIVFWLDNAIPVKYRGCVKEGIEMWNQVFEKECGISNAIVVKQRPDDADWDIGDMRYNMIRWTVNLPFAISLVRANPFTGQILNASINFDAGFAEGGASTWDNIVVPTLSEPMKTTMAKDGMEIEDPQREGAQQLNFGLTAMELLQEPGVPLDKEVIIRQYIRQVTCHEMGHTLGLRHNFTASTARTAAELADPEVSRTRGLTASVMDYMPYNIYALKHPGVDYYSRMAGEYDRWAIHYGYMKLNEDTPRAELPALRQWASHSGEPGHAFETDQMSNNWDPYVYTFDMANNSLDWMEKTMNTSRYLLLTLGDRKPRDGQSYYEFTRTFNGLLNSYINAGISAERYIGGVRVTPNFRGDVGEKPVYDPVSGAQQRRALEMVNKYLLSPNAFDMPKSYFAKLTPDPDTPGTQTSSQTRTYPVFTTFSNAQAAALSNLFNVQRLQRIQNNEYRASSTKNMLTMASLYRTVTDNVWAECSSGREITSLRRQLQRNHLNMLIANVINRPAGLPDDAVTLSYEQLRKLEHLTAEGAHSAKGEYGRAHLAECNMRIKQALAANIQRREVGQ